jgi:hypothetical protein
MVHEDKNTVCVQLEWENNLEKSLLEKEEEAINNVGCWSSLSARGGLD